MGKRKEPAGGPARLPRIPYGQEAVRNAENRAKRNRRRVLAGILAYKAITRKRG